MATLHLAQEILNIVCNKIYPVGSIYMSVNSTNPSSLFGGTWVAWGSGRVPVGINTNDTDFNTVEKTGGNKTNSLAALIGNIDADVTRMAYVPGQAVKDVRSKYDAYGYNNLSNFYRGKCGFNHSTPVKTLNNTDPPTLQPYITCYIWKRTA